ncbi:uncharacterized protein LOC131205314 [Anopheles bellator]|uniref:uncharacterized protein LOC131205314 n=1 Tax=Anopheles bellator TaxID=139047 RepID=UPI0026476C31|nr:uncharacterized protein LOC131205314 [Anopheles bellator]
MLFFEFVETWKHLVLILLEFPALQDLRIDCFFRKYRKQIVPFRVFPELKSWNRRQRFSFFRTNIPNLQCLKMECSTEFELDAWKYFSGQLKLVHVYGLDRSYLHPFLELTFPRLEDLAIKIFEFSIKVDMDFRKSKDFFGRHPSIRRLSFGNLFSVKCVQIISHHCAELAHLCLTLDIADDGNLESLVQLSKLKHLSLEGKVERKVLRGPMKSLESVALDVPHPQILLDNLFEVVPRLSCLKITTTINYDELEFICEKFSWLRHLELCFCNQQVAEDSVRFDRLEHLQELKLSHYFEIPFLRSCHRNNVRSLTIYRWRELLKTKEDDLCLVPERFPLLKRLMFLNNDNSMSLAAVERLHKLMPSCRIDYGDHHFYPIASVTAD